MNQKPQSVTITATKQEVPAGISGRVVGLRVTGSTTVVVELYDGTSTSDTHIGGVAADGVSLGVMPITPGYLPEFKNGLHVDVAGATPNVELQYISETAPIP